MFPSPNLIVSLYTPLKEEKPLRIQMKFWQALLLLDILGTVHGGENVGVDSPTDTPPLRCYTCLSKKSWDHCQAKAEIRNCEPDESCLTVKAYHTKKTANNTKEEVVHLYAKYCSAECSKKQCREMGWLCDVSCCSSQECNASVSNTSPSSCAMIASAIALSYIIVHDFFAL